MLRLEPYKFKMIFILQRVVHNAFNKK